MDPLLNELLVAGREARELLRTRLRYANPNSPSMAIYNRFDEALMDMTDALAEKEGSS